MGSGKKGWGDGRAGRGCGEEEKQGEVKGGGLGGECRMKGGGVQGRIEGCRDAEVPCEGLWGAG